MEEKSHSDPDDVETEADDSNGSDGDTGERRVGVGTGVVGGGRPLKKGPWTPEEDNLLATYVRSNGEGNWNQVQKNAGLNRCGKSCRLRWANHLRPELKKGPFDKDEENKIIEMHLVMGNKWAKMTASLPGRTDNEIKNFWNTRSKKLLKLGLNIYPDELLSRTKNQDMDCHSPDDSRSKKRPNEVLQGNGPEVEGIVFKKLDYNKQSENIFIPGSFYPNPPPSDVMNPLKRHASSGNIASEYNVSLTTLTYEHYPNHPEKTGYSTDFSYGITQNHSVPFGSAIASGQPISDGNISSSGTIQRPSNMELSSFQNSHSIGNNSCHNSYPSASPILQADTDACSTVSASLTEECLSPEIAALLDPLQEWDGLGDCTNSQGLTEDLVPHFSHDHPLGPSSPVTDKISPSCVDTLFPSTCHSDSIFTDKHIPPPLHDTSLEANYLNENSQHSNYLSSNYLFSEVGDRHEEPRLPDADLQLEFDPCIWDSMPGACDMPDFPDQDQKQ